ncbi:hypothetical protein A3H22_03510 [Candidatus Peribacteria bacterium RIFCSPLOWO2_12_FULL_55_15]|nr:MAG: hypothetical protein A2789_00965 [Candidatus Peribacteria bacterium RIFCSPHIGHO2_01_FULL_54_22]OGJ62203.1 MAG: hypothetical protein A3D12_00080 [Candidatus Peribacteria bacterium RIFCSPHIGHO2_02_FULL_55_24]OGJ64701.1 MAG: hypothetical protein A3E47_03610 [Candidatus Peribacteria bacterium RIFCSPHIGHO2_12_FULL_54_10]OGJ69043.1 MAG: hypothetical protein A2947_00215 [Candidatus Peribacteria bacterium RIFCSPLOWO2_01_FULL_54_110]OGJ69923.1 MAG: hypothetical protein A3H90_00865 [Candidatus Pe
MDDRVTLLGIPVDSVTQEEAVRMLHRFLDDGRAMHVMTPNSEMFTEAARNPVFRAVLQRSALNLPDSVGLIRMARWTGQKIAERVTGVDTVERLCAELTEEHPVFLLGGVEGVGGRASEILCARNPRLRVVGTCAGSPREEDVEEILRRINDAKPHLLLVAFGAPHQDIWIDRHLPAMPSVRVAIGIGGTLDFLAGVQKRAPVLVQKLGFEWLWRFIHEPQRFRRIWNAVVVFPWLVLRYKAFPPPFKVEGRERV